MSSPEAQGEGLNFEELQLKPDGIAQVVQGAVARQMRILRIQKRLREQIMPTYSYKENEHLLGELRFTNGVTAQVLDQIVEAPEGFENWRSGIEQDAAIKFAAEQPKP